MALFTDPPRTPVVLAPYKRRVRSLLELEDERFEYSQAEYRD